MFTVHSCLANNSMILCVGTAYFVYVWHFCCVLLVRPVQTISLQSRTTTYNVYTSINVFGENLNKTKYTRVWAHYVCKYVRRFIHTETFIYSFICSAHFGWFCFMCSILSASSFIFYILHFVVFFWKQMLLFVFSQNRFIIIVQHAYWALFVHPFKQYKQINKRKL